MILSSSDTIGLRGTSSVEQLRCAGQKSRRRLLQMHFEAGVGHLGGNLSCLDILTVLFHTVLGDRDRFILSKGHACGALYVALWSIGKLSDEDLRTFHQDNTRLSGHPSGSWLAEIPFSTGSLGHGLSLANGMALARKLRSIEGRVFCLLSDGELNEGSSWEALFFLAHHRLPVTVVIDKNGFQGFGSTDEVLKLGNFPRMLTALDLEVNDIDGHSYEALVRSFTEQKNADPRIIIARTVKGRGVPAFEGTMRSHYLPLTPEQYEEALEGLTAE